MRERLPLILSGTALVVALFGTTPLGHAAGSAIEKVVPLAKVALFAKNAGKLNGHRSATDPRAGEIPVLDATGKLPASIGAVGPAGPAGPAGSKGDTGAPGLVRAYAHINADGSLDTTRDHKGVIGSGLESSYTCVQLEPSINAARAIPSVTPDLSNFTFGPSTTHIGWAAVRGSGCSTSNALFIAIGGLGTSENGGNPFIVPGSFYLLVP